MIKTFDLVKPETLPDERLFGLVHRARQIAIEIEGVYDLALYQTDRASRWQCSVDVDDEQAWELLQADSERLRRRRGAPMLCSVLWSTLRILPGGFRQPWQKQGSFCYNSKTHSIAHKGARNT